ncbi:MAG: hypothetical protein ABII82_02020 [Verrucomicrobiota bacterium]
MKNIPLPIRPLLALVALCLTATFLEAQPADSRRELKIFEPAQRWQFLPGAEFAPGGKGTFTLAREDGRSVGVLTHDLTAGGNYVGGLTRIDIPEGYSELRFRVRADKPASIAIRLADETGQTHQTPFRYAEAGDWQLLRLDLTRRAPLRFGGANDGQTHYPLKSLTLIIERKGQDTPGEIRFADVVLQK